MHTSEEFEPKLLEAWKGEMDKVNLAKKHGEKREGIYQGYHTLSCPESLTRKLRGNVTSMICDADSSFLS